VGKKHVRHWLRGVLTLVLLVPLLATLSALFASNVGQYRATQHGRENGLATDQAPLEQPRFGTNVALERYADEPALRAVLALLREAELGTLRQRFAWAELEPSPGAYQWETWDRVLPILQSEGFGLIALLDTSPDWARAEWEASNPWAPPVDVADYARFVSAFAARYGAYISAYQVWDQPNIAPHWGAGEVDPAGYVALLAAASEAIRAADPQARIIAGGLAPNTESGGRNLSDLQYLREILRRGALEHCDILGVKAYGFWSGAYDRRADEDLLNFSRVSLARAELVRRGAEALPIWLLEGGWCALPEPWTGAAPPLGNDSAFVQSQRLGQAVERITQEWPWLSLACLQVAQPDAASDDPVWGFALLDAQGATTALYTALLDHALGVSHLSPGLTRDWQRYALPEQARVHFWGTDLHLLLERDAAQGDLVARVAGKTADLTFALPTSARNATETEPARVRVASRLTPGLHTLELQGTPAQLAAVSGILVGNRTPARRWLALIVSGLLLLWVLWLTVRVAKQVPWGRAWSRTTTPFARLPRGWQTALVLGALAAAILCPVPMLRPALLLVYAILALLRPDLALLIAVACIPFAPFNLSLAQWRFSLAEVATLVAAGAYLGNTLLAAREQPPHVPFQQLQSVAARRLSRILAALRAWRLADWAVLALLLLSLATCFLAEYQRVAFREWRVVIAEPVLLYLLVRQSARAGPAREREQPGAPNAVSLKRLMDVLYLGGLAVACYALLVYRTPQGVIEAEGVRRARAFYGSPNNLALYLERLLPLGLALAAWARTRWRRWLYGLGTLPMLTALVLTYSRGAWLLGLPAGLLALAWLRGGRWRYVALALLIVGAVVLVPLARTPRFAGLVDPTSGTTFLRISLWQASWDMLREHAWRGIGLDNFLYYYRDYIRPGAEVDRYLSHPHNLVLDFWLRLGIGGLAVLGAMIAAHVVGARRAFGRLRGDDVRAMLLGLTAGMAAALAHGLIDASFFVIELAYVWLLALAWVTTAAHCVPGRE